MNEGENPPIGIILCLSKEAEVVELMKLDKARIHVEMIKSRQKTIECGRHSMVFCMWEYPTTRGINYIAHYILKVMDGIQSI